MPRWFAAVAVAVLVSFTSADIAFAAGDQVIDGRCPGAEARPDAVSSLVSSVRSIDWNRVGTNAWAFTEGALVGFVTGVAVSAGIAVAVATFPAWATAITVGTTVVGAGMALYGAYQVYRNWDQMTERDLYRLGGGIVGGLASGLVDPAKLPIVGRYIRNAAGKPVGAQQYLRELADSEAGSPRVRAYQESVSRAASIDQLATNRYGEAGAASLAKLRSALGNEYEVLVSDPGIVMRLDDFLAFAKTQKKVAPWQMRELYSQHLGVSKVYRGLALTSEQAATMQKDGMYSGYLRPDHTGNPEWSQADPFQQNFFSMMKERIRGGGWGRISSAPDQPVSDSLMSVTFDRETAFGVPAQMIKQIRLAGEGQNLGVYVYQVDVPTLDLMPGPVHDAFPKDYVNTTELFLPWKIKPGEIRSVEGPLQPPARPQ